MNDGPLRSELPRHLEIRAVEVIAGRGRSITFSSVRCPVRGRTAAVEECAHCGKSGGVAQDVLANGAWVRCHAPLPVEQPGDEPRVRAVMRRGAVAVRPGLSAATASAALRARGEAGAPVVDGEGRPLGWVTEADLVRVRSGGTVRDAIPCAALAVAEDASLSRAASLLASHDLERIAVVAPDGVVVGVLSALDVLRWLAAPSALG